MIKKYNQFIKENDDFMEESSFEETEARLAAEDLEKEMDTFNNEPDNSEEFEEEVEDLYASKLQELADKLGTEVVNGKVEYKGKTIIFPSETDMYHVDDKKLETSDDVVNYLEGGLNESKSYKNRYNSKVRRKK
jgi:hypothetical protein